MATLLAMSVVTPHEAAERLRELTGQGSGFRAIEDGTGARFRWASFTLSARVIEVSEACCRFLDGEKVLAEVVCGPVSIH